MGEETASRCRLAAGATTAALVAAAAAGAPAAAAPGAGGERTAAVEGATLAVRVSDGRDEVAAGDEARYTLTLRNDADREQSAVVSQRVSGDAEFVDVGADGETAGAVARWRVEVGPGAEIERTARVRLGEPGRRLWRVATTVCAQTEAGAPPVACATDANTVDRSTRTAASAVSAPQRVLTVTGLFTGVLLVLATAAAAAVLGSRLRPSARGTPGRGDAA
ncbi:hypothetical protein [Streptomonospora salina]|uniref:DUF11 domain-containing protein n=1 Tax=Streptomonospora salina TaxID=104205 RepID=A0A841E6E6_9ACTN|nr:hypothetical protein [Streptomonospora salina]MBB5996879.1 hypothetical protein [Streptomonospora salina]